MFSVANKSIGSFVVIGNVVNVVIVVIVRL